MKLRSAADLLHVELIAADLSVLLADEYVLYTKSRKAHWNLDTRNFFVRNSFFEEHYKYLDVMIDELAARMRGIGYCTSAKLKDFLSITNLTEESMAVNNGEVFIAELLADHETIILTIKALLSKDSIYKKDAKMRKFISCQLEKHQKMAWILRTHLEL